MDSSVIIAGRGGEASGGNRPPPAQDRVMPSASLEVISGRSGGSGLHRLEDEDACLRRGFHFIARIRVGEVVSSPLSCIRLGLADWQSHNSCGKANDGGSCG